MDVLIETFRAHIFSSILLLSGNNFEIFSKVPMNSFFLLESMC